MIKFEKTNNAPEDTILPARSTKYSAGYDFYAPHDIALPPRRKSEIVWLNIKAKIPCDKYLKLENRSSLMNKGVALFCSGIIDSDYYGNEKNDGNIGVSFFNHTNGLIILRKGDKICQGIILSYYVTFDDSCNTRRQGGFGSTGA